GDGEREAFDGAAGGGDGRGDETVPEAAGDVEGESVAVEARGDRAGEIGHDVAVFFGPCGECVAIERRAVDEPMERRLGGGGFVGFSDDGEFHDWTLHRREGSG